MKTKMNDDIRIRYSDSSTSDEIILELMKIESDVYAPEYRGEYDSIAKRFHKFRDMFVFAYDGDKVIGYLCFFPISKRLHDEIVYSEGFHDDDIEPEDVVQLTHNNYIYFLSIALYKAYQGRGIGRTMVDAFFDKLKEESEKGRNIEDIVASVVTDQGEKIARDYGFSLVKDYSETAHYKLFRKGENEI